MNKLRLHSLRILAGLAVLLAGPKGYSALDSGLVYGNPPLQIDTEKPITFYDAEKTKVKTAYYLGLPRILLKPLGVEALLGCYYFGNCAPDEMLAGFYESGALKFASMSRPQELILGDGASAQPQKAVSLGDAHINPLVFSETGELLWVPTDYSAEMKGIDGVIKLIGIRPKKSLGVPNFKRSVKLHSNGSVQIACLRWGYEPVRIITVKGIVTIPEQTSAILHFREDGIVEKWTTGSCDE